VSAMTPSMAPSYGPDTVEVSAAYPADRSSAYYNMLGTRSKSIVRDIELVIASPASGAGSDGEPRRQEISMYGGYATNWWLGGDGLRLPVKAVLQHGDGEVVALNPDTDIYGVGLTATEAVSDLRVALLEHYDVLRDAGDELTEDLRRQRTFLTLRLVV